MFRPAKPGLLAALLAFDASVQAATPSFREDVIPLLTRAGCNMGACPGRPRTRRVAKLMLSASTRPQSAADLREAFFADLIWALMNTKEFAFNH